MRKKIIAIFSVIVLIAAVQFFTFSTKEEANSTSINDFYSVKFHELNHDINFCGEKVPLYSSDIMERFDKEILKNSYWHSEMLLYYKRGGKYFPVIEPILKKNGIPEDFKYLAIIESGLSNVVSPAGAAGFWQIMEKTAESYGLEVNENIDERYNLIKATEAACKYLNEAHERFKSWTLVAASYNMGMNGLERRLKAQKTNNYYDLLLNSETSRYVFRILAIKDILTNPKKYGFNVSKSKAYKNEKTTEIMIDSSITDLSEFAKKIGYNYKIIKLFNPWLKQKDLKNKEEKTYTLLLPQENYYVFDDTESSNDSSALSINNDSLTNSNDVSLISKSDSTDIDINDEE